MGILLLMFWHAKGFQSRNVSDAGMRNLLRLLFGKV